MVNGVSEPGTKARIEPKETVTGVHFREAKSATGPSPRGRRRDTCQGFTNR